MFLCFPCAHQGFCRKTMTPVLTNDELEQTNVVKGVRWCAFRRKVDPCKWLEFSTDLNRDYQGWFFNPKTKREVFINMEPLEDAPYEWWRDFCCRPPGLKPHVRPEAWERVRSLGSILRASFPKEAILWGLSPANDNTPRDTL